MITNRYNLVRNPLALNIASILAGILGVTFTLTNLTLPGLTFDSLSVFSAIIAVLKNKKERFNLINK